MTRLAPLLALSIVLALSACTSGPAPTDGPARSATRGGPTRDAATRGGARTPSAADWLARARQADAPPLGDGTPPDAAYAAQLVAEKRITDEIDAAVGWARACDTYWDAAAGREVWDATATPHALRGTYDVHAVGPDEAVAAVTCDFGAFQGAYVLVHVQAGRADLLRAAYVGPDGAVSGPPSPIFATPRFTPGARTFDTLALARALGDCGLLSRYRLGTGAAATLVEARSRDCDERATTAPPPETWPVAFPRP